MEDVHSLVEWIRRVTQTRSRTAVNSTSVVSGASLTMCTTRPPRADTPASDLCALQLPRSNIPVCPYVNYNLQKQVCLVDEYAGPQ
ncbi:hypothetical protein Hamer_G015319, partial [Homarus americanus]